MPATFQPEVANPKKKIFKLKNFAAKMKSKRNFNPLPTFSTFNAQQEATVNNTTTTLR